MICHDTQYDSNVSDVPRELVLAILRVVQVEKIICFGKRASGTETWSCFLPRSEGQWSVIYDLLIITAPDEKRNRHEILDMIDRISTSAFTVNALVHGIINVNEALACGSFFFATIYERGLIVYDKGANRLVVPCQRSAPTQAIIESRWGKWFGLAQQFLNGATHFSSCGWNNIAAFMLHQAVEATCLALIRVITGYRATTHNLSRLMTMTANFTSALQAIFPRNTKEEADLFHALTRAYSDVRYKEGFEIAGVQIVIMIERIKMLQRHAERLYKEKLLQMHLAATSVSRQQIKNSSHENSPT